MASKIQLRGDTAAALTSANPVLSAKEPCIETDTYKIKYGDGVTAWNSLAYSAIPPANPTFSGIATIVGLKETKIAMSANDINLATGTFFTKTISGAATLTLSNVAASGLTNSFILDLTNGGSATVTWWANLKWVGGTAPTLTAAGRDSLGFYTYDAGTTWTGLVLGKDIK